MKNAESKTVANTKKSSTLDSQFFSEELGTGFFNKSGNGAVMFSGGDTNNSNSFFSNSILQPKLTIGQPDDKYEQEADAMADQVVQKLSKPDALQRKCTSCEQEEGNIAPKLQTKPIFESNEEAPVQRKCEACKSAEIKPSPIQMSAGSLPNLQASSDLESRLNSSKGGGQPLAEDTQQSMSNAFGTDFSGVRVHTGSSSVQMNQELGARAFTNGSDIYFNSGEYNPETSGGQHLLAHELTHVVQQRNNGIQTKLIQRSGKRGAIINAKKKDGEGVHFKNLILGKYSYGIMTTWREGDTIETNVRRVFPKWLIWRFGSKMSPENRKLALEDCLSRVVRLMDSSRLKVGWQYYFFLSPKDMLYYRRLAGETGSRGGGGKGKSSDNKGGGSNNKGGDRAKGDKSGGGNQENPDKEVQGVQVTSLATKEDIKFLKRMMGEIFGPSGQKPKDKIGGAYISMEDIKALRILDQQKNKEAIINVIKQMGSSSGASKLQPTLSELIETAEAYLDVQKHKDLPGLDLVSGGSSSETPLVPRPVRGVIVNRTCPNDPANPANNQCLVPGMEAEFMFVQTDKVDKFRVPHLKVAFTAIKRKEEGSGDEFKETLTEIDSQTLNYIEVRDDSIINDKIFSVTFPEKGEYEVHCIVHHNFYTGNAHFQIPVIVKTKKQRLDEMNAASEGRADTESFGQVDESTRNSKYTFQDVDDEDTSVKIGIGLLVGGIPGLLLPFSDNPNAVGERSEGELSDEVFKEGKGNFKNSTRELDRQIGLLDKLIARNKAKKGSQDIISWAKDRKGQLEAVLAKLQNLQRDRGTKPVAVQAFYVSDKGGVRSGELKLVCWFNYEKKEGDDQPTIKANLFDHTELVRADHFHFQAEGTDYEKVMEKLFFYLSQTYPKGRMRFSFQAYQGELPTKKFIQYERETTTLLNDIQEVAFSQPVSIAVNVVSTILTCFPPTAPIGIGISLAYNGAQTALEFLDASRSGTVRASNYVDIGLLMLDVLPILGKATKIATKGGKALRLLSVGKNIAEFGGNVYMFTEGAFHQIGQIRNGLMTELAGIEEEIQQLSDTAKPGDRKAAALIREKRKEAEKLKLKIRTTAADVVTEMAANQAISLVSQAAARKIAKSMGGSSSASQDVDDDIDPHKRRKNRWSDDDSDPEGLIDRDADAVIGDTSKAGRSNSYLRRGLPADLRHKVQVIRATADSKGNPVRGQGVSVEFDTTSFGTISNIRIVAGSTARIKDINLHVDTVRLLQRYSGLSGFVRTMGIKANNVLAKYSNRFGKKPPPDSRAFIAAAEVNKLPAIIQERANLLTKHSGDPEVTRQLRMEIDDLQQQLKTHQEALNNLDFELGAGFVAAKGKQRKAKSNAAAAAVGYPDIEKDPTLAPGYYYRERPKGSGKYELVAYADTPRTMRNKRLRTRSDGTKVIEDIPPGERKKTTRERFDDFKDNNAHDHSSPISGFVHLESELSQRFSSERDKATVRRWGAALKALYDQAGVNKQQLISDLLDNLPDNFSDRNYRDFRRAIRSAMIESVMKGSSKGNRTPGQQISELRSFLKTLPDGDERTKGELLSAYRRRLQGGSVSRPGRLSYMSELSDVSKQLPPPEGGKKTFADGAVEVKTSQKRHGGPPRGKFMLEDKAGDSFNKGQAKHYSDLLSSDGGLKSIKGDIFDGIIYHFENEMNARNNMDFIRDLHRSIYVGYINDQGQLKWIKR